MERIIRKAKGRQELEMPLTDGSISNWCGLNVCRRVSVGMKRASVVSLVG